jgi:hypothetical protein
MWPTTDRSVAGMRALSLKAGITMLYFGYWVTTQITVFEASEARLDFQRDSRHHILQRRTGLDAISSVKSCRRDCFSSE